MIEPERRARFYEGQYLEAADLTAAVGYARSQLARAQLGAHRWGIALGLDLREVPGPGNVLDVFIQPGYAWDGFGRPVVVSEPARVPPAAFASFDADFVAGNSPPPPVTVPVWLRYDETMASGPRGGFETCASTAPFSRVREAYRVEVGLRNQLSDRRDPLELAGREIDAAQALAAFDPTAAALPDASVPFQLFPDEGERRNWLIPIGLVRWQPGNPGSFVARTPAEVVQSARIREYCGVVAGSVEATGGQVRVHDRRLPYSPSVTDELLSVEGAMRLDGHARLYGSRIEFVRNHNESPPAPFHLLRRDDMGAGRKTLQVVIGDQSAGDNRFVVGTKTGTDPEGRDLHSEHVVVTDQGRVGVGTSEPAAPLHLTAEGLEIGASATAQDNFHIQSNTDGPRGLRLYNGDVGAGTHIASFTQSGRVGIGLTDPTNTLHVNGALGVRQNAMYLSGDRRWSSLTFNAHHNAANNDWVFPDPAQPAVTIEMDNVNGTPRFEVYSTRLGDTQSWVSRLRVLGHSGDVGMAAAGGNVGVGTYSPLAKLDVRGDLRVTGEIEFDNPLRRPVAGTPGLRVVCGNVGTSGTRVEGEGFSVARLGPGRYRITFDEAFPSPPTVIVSKVYETFQSSAGALVRPAQNAIVDQVVPGSTVIATAGASGALADSNFCFLALGPR